MNKLNYICLLSALLALFSGCKKDEKQNTSSDNNRIAMVVADNFNLSIFSTGLNRGGLKAKLLEAGPFTAIAPSDDAFAKIGFSTPVKLLGADPALVSGIMNYHVLNGRYELNKLPFLFNQEIRSGNGGKLFVTHWVKGKDTVLTINGSRVLAQNIGASNGLIQVIDRVLEPYKYDNVVQAIASDRDLTLFHQALQRAGLIETLNGKGPYTIFAASNTAMNTLGFPDLQTINNADPAMLAALLRYHILNDRRFIYDYILSTGPSAQSDQRMLDGNSVRINLTPNPSIPGTYNGITLKGTGNTSVVNVIKQDVLTGNGVVHNINNPLKITQ